MLVFDIDLKNKIVTRTKVRRLVEEKPVDDSKTYTIMEERKIWSSRAGKGGKVIIAVSKEGKEIIELGSRFAFSTRTSPFSQIITGVYKRIYHKDDHKKSYKKRR